MSNGASKPKAPSKSEVFNAIAEKTLEAFHRPSAEKISAALLGLCRY